MGIHITANLEIDREPQDLQAVWRLDSIAISTIVAGLNKPQKIHQHLPTLNHDRLIGQ
jgi:hypothetical protein